MMFSRWTLGIVREAVREYFAPLTADYWLHVKRRFFVWRWKLTRRHRRVDGN